MTSQEKLFDLIDKIGKNRETVVRDDQYEFPDILDAVQKARSRRARINLVDTGRFGVSELEWLGDAGVHLFTSDKARSKTAELLLIRKTYSRHRALTALWQRGPIEDEDRPGRLSFASLKELAGAGFIIHISNREHPRDFSALTELSKEAVLGGGLLVYYHHGSPVIELGELASRGARIHISDRNMHAGDFDRMKEILEASRALASNLTYYIEKGTPVFLLRRLYDEGAVLLFKTPPSERGSALGALEQKARRRSPKKGAYYLYTNYLL